MGGDSNTHIGTSDPMDHLSKILRLKEEQRKALKDLDVENIIDFYGVAQDDAFLLKGGKEIESLFSNAMKNRLQYAWHWIDKHHDKILDDKFDSWFLENFKPSFRNKVFKRKRAVDALTESRQQEEENKRFKIVQQHQGNASSFTGNGSKTMGGVATLPPVFYEHLIPEQVKKHFTEKFNNDKSAEREVITELSRAFMCHGTSYTLKAVPETSAKRNVQIDHLDFIATQFDGQITTERIFKDGLDKESRRTLKDIGLEGGISTPLSYPDAYFHTKPLTKLSPHVNFITTSIFECKDTAASPDSGHGEGIANATNAAIAMLRVGIPSSRIVVPVFTTTGSLVQVAAVYMLEPSSPDKPSLPAVCFVTKILNLSDKSDSKRAAAILVAMARHTEELELYVKSKNLTRLSSVVMGLDPDKYHCKLMNDFFSVLACKTASLTHMLAVTSPLAGTSYACLPIAIRLKDQQCSSDAIIFEKLDSYSIGLPRDPNDRRALVLKMEEVVDDMHKKGVIHMDLYLSNFMWKKEAGGSFSVQIIDFDAVHELGEKLTDNTWLRLRELDTDFYTLGRFATKKHDDLYMKMLREKIDEKDLQIGDSSETEKDVKNRLDGACMSFMADIFAVVRK